MASKDHPRVDLTCSGVNLGAIGGRNAAVAHARARFAFDHVLFLAAAAQTFLTLLSRHATWPEKPSAASFVPLRGIFLFSRFAVAGNRQVISAQLSGVRDLLLARRERPGKP